jgi:putative PIN family toxin of toxin-antitoxin system
MLVLYDTNVLVTILSRRDAILVFKKDVSEKRIVHISSLHILSEVEAVLSEKMGLTKQKAKTAARLLERLSKIVNPTVVEKNCRDPFDDYVLAAAKEGGVDYLVTEDNDLLILNNYQNVNIVNISTFRHILDK